MSTVQGRPPKPLVEPLSMLLAVAAWIIAYWLLSVLLDRQGGAGDSQADAFRRAPGGLIAAAIFLHYGLGKIFSATAALATMGVVVDLALAVRILTLGSGQ
jgi:hypothetical protein